MYYREYGLPEHFGVTIQLKSFAALQNVIGINSVLREGEPFANKNQP
jgi:hypothetical protein